MYARGFFLSVHHVPEGEEVSEEAAACLRGLEGISGDSEGLQASAVGAGFYEPVIRVGGRRPTES